MSVNMHENRNNMFIVNFRSCTRFEKEALGQLGFIHTQ